ncbi:MAG: lytic transglycosylase domain-containing protein, partial [Calditrichia bacterium]
MSSGSGQEFPYHDALKTDIRFWKKVFTEIHSNQYLIHDSEYLSIIYEVVSFDSTVSERRQEKRIEKIKEGYKKLLLKFHYNRIKISELPPREQKLYKQFETIKEKNKFKKAAKRIRAQRGIRENFLSGVERSFAYLPSMEKIFNYYGLPKNLIYMPHIESSFNPRAASHVGARGMWQFMRSTARLYMRVNSRVDERYDPVYSTRAAAKLLKKNYQVLKDWALAITAYNHGLGSMKRARRKFGRDYLKIRENYLRRSFGFASKNFYPEFLAAVELMDSLDHYFPGLNKHQPLQFQDLKLTRSINLPRFCRKMNISINELKELNPSYKRSLWRGSRKISKGYNLRLPAETDMKQVLAYFYQEAVKENLALSREKQKSLQQNTISPGKVKSSSAKTIVVNLLKPSVEPGEIRVDIGKIKLAFKENRNKKSAEEKNRGETPAIKIAGQTTVEESGKNLKKKITTYQLEEILAANLA